ncbi:hypothetical protein VTN96DRAFT_10124 [Rasamsonia emersonii]
MTRHGDARAANGHPPIYRIDLSLPPRERYVELSRLYRDELHSLTDLFDELVEAFLPNVPVKFIRGLARLALRRLFTTEETEEIRGISQAAGVDMYLLVAFNVLLDVLMGCTSGGVRVKAEDSSHTKMLHFRTLDWGMDALRKLIVQLEYVSSPDTDEILATSITYVGFVGVLTAVRKGLSVSLNFRPIHDTSRRWANFRFYFSHLLVLLGTRRSISSLLRQCILPETAPRHLSFSSYCTLPWRRRKSDNTSSIRASNAPSLAFLQDRIPSEPTTAAYLIFSDGASTMTMEKDHRTAVVRSSSSFIVITNNDLEPDAPSTGQIAKEKQESHAGLSLVSGELESMIDIIAESNLRRACIQEQWDKKVRRAAGAGKRTSSHPTREEVSCEPDDDIAATPREVIKWLKTYPVTNETTHFATVMDPTEGKVVWVRRYPIGFTPDTQNAFSSPNVRLP